MRKLLFPAIICMIVLTAVNDTAAQKRLRLDAELGLDFWFDNREYKSELTPDMTLFGTMLTPQIGLRWADGHSVFVGTNLTLEFGSKPFERNPEFIIYYGYDNRKSFKAYAGVFPRKKVMGDYPTLFFSDSVRYYDSNLEGALFQYYGRRGYVEFAVDWLSMISDSEHEKFVIFSAGKMVSNNRKLYAGYYASVFHHSSTYQEMGVVDNILAYPYVGFRLSGGGESHSKKHHFLNFKAGWVQAMQHDRINEDKFVSPGGAQVELTLEKWRVGIYNTLYVGDNLMPYYGLYGPGLYQGDAFYRTGSDIYDRLELYWHPVRDVIKNLRISSVHHYDGKKWNWQQLVTFSINLNRSNTRW